MQRQTMNALLRRVPKTGLLSSALATSAARRTVGASLALAGSRRFAHGGHVATTDAPQVSLLDTLKERFPGQDAQVAKRLEQLKRNHMQYLSMEINWNAFKPEQQTEYLRELEDLIKTGYHSMTPEQKKEVSLSNVEALSPDTTDFKTWDNILQKNEELQLGDWKNMTLEEKKAAYYLAWGPVPQTHTEYRNAIFMRTALIILASIVVYTAAFQWMRSKKTLPSLEPEHIESQRERMIKERMNPYTGESAHLFPEKK